MSLGNTETAKLLKTVAPLIDQVSGRFYSSWGSPDCTNVLLTSLFKRVYLRKICVLFCGKIAYAFLEDQINNAPFLRYVKIDGRSWPKSTLDLLAKFCSKGRPGNRADASVFCDDLIIDSSFMQHLLDLWKTNENPNFRFRSFQSILNEEYRAVVKNYKVFEMRNGSRKTFFKHPTAKSIARVSNVDFSMDIFTCECDRFEKCLLKKRYPKFHDF
uniref:Nucleotid_trans domain-containing protein n=1 Tax=Steinernema glaseri TaxID=37863 RepID=A0A1I7YNC0_9BILA